MPTIFEEARAVVLSPPVACRGNGEVWIWLIFAILAVSAADAAAQTQDPAEQIVVQLEDVNVVGLRGAASGPVERELSTAEVDALFRHGIGDQGLAGKVGGIKPVFGGQRMVARHQRNHFADK